MKQIKRQVAAIAIAFTAATLSSCSDKENDFVDAEAQDFSEEQIEKVAYGCGTYADWDEEGEKEETTASDEYLAMLKERLARERNAGGNKSVALEQMVGVVKDKTCGKYDEVRIYYDSEDKKPNYKASHGYRGDWVSYHNLTMYFCLVPARLFHSTKDNYGVMNFSNYNHFLDDPNFQKVARIDGYMDAEDSRNE